jgi:tRNA (guanine-N7-)-methyltransferase
MLRAENLELTNLRLIQGDAVVLLKEHIAPASLAGVRIFFPDPWPKKKHHKRRLVQPEFVALVASRLQPGGTLHMATDWEHYAEQMLEVCAAELALRNRYADEPGGWAPRPEWRPVTKFENRADAEGRISHDLIFERVTAGEPPSQ